jgi:hypothetical protein
VLNCGWGTDLLACTWGCFFSLLLSNVMGLRVVDMVRCNRNKCLTEEPKCAAVIWDKQNNVTHLWRDYDMVRLRLKHTEGESVRPWTRSCRRTVIYTPAVQKRVVHFVETGFSDRENFIIVRNSLTNSGLKNNNTFSFQGNGVKGSGVWESMCNIFLNSILFAICTSTLSKSCRRLIQWHVEESQ